MISPFLTRPIPKPSKTIAEDPQRTRLYKMEREFVGISVYHAVSKDNLETLMRHACRYYNMPAPKLVVYNDPRDRKFGSSNYEYYEPYCVPFNHEIKLNRGFHGANACTLMHELAHYIVDSIYENHSGHGKKFVGVYMHLLDKYRIMPSDAFRTIAKRHKIQIAGKFKPDAINPKCGKR